MSVHDMQGLEDEAKEYAGNESPLKSSEHSMRVIWASARVSQEFQTVDASTGDSVRMQLQAQSVWVGPEGQRFSKFLGAASVANPKSTL